MNFEATGYFEAKSREIDREVNEILSSRSSEFRVLRTDNFGRLIEVRAPAVRLVKLPVGARGKYGDPITEHTPDSARLAHEKIANSVRLEGARYSGHDIEGHVRIKGKQARQYRQERIAPAKVK